MYFSPVLPVTLDYIEWSTAMKKHKCGADMVVVVLSKRNYLLFNAVLVAWTLYSQMMAWLMNNEP